MDSLTLLLKVGIVDHQLLSVVDTYSCTLCNGLSVCPFALRNLLFFDRPWTSAGVSLILLGLVLVARAAFVFPLSFISNLTRKSQTDKVGFKQQVVITWLNYKFGL